MDAVPVKAGAFYRGRNEKGRRNEPRTALSLCWESGDAQAGQKRIPGRDVPLPGGRGLADSGGQFRFSADVRLYLRGNSAEIPEQLPPYDRPA